jgi:uncharacterized protein YecE (DUF72 family)
MGTASHRRQPSSHTPAEPTPAGPRIRVGISGWRYQPWREVFYPQGLPQRLELQYAATVFDTIEINGSFYSLQRPSSWIAWRDATRDDFVFTVKGPRYITHLLQLRDVRQPLANFLASGLLALDGKLGPILWQFPPRMRFDPGRFAEFLQLLPPDTEQALALAREHDNRLRGRSHLAIDEPRRLRHAVEVRHDSFLDARFVAMLRAAGVALVVAETARKWPMPCDVTADFMYLRLHGDKDIYRSGYSDAAIGRWAERIGHWHAGREPGDLPPGAVRIDGASRVDAAAARDVFCYFDNTDEKLRAPRDAQTLMRKLGQRPGRWAAVSSRASGADRPARARTPARTPRRTGAAVRRSPAA